MCDCDAAMHIGHVLTRAATRYPDRPAWVAGDRAVTYRDAESRVNQLARALGRLEAVRGDRIAMLLPNCPEGLETIIAPMKLGCAVVPLNVRLHPREHAELIDDAGAVVLVYGDEFDGEVAGLKPQLRTVRHFVRVGAPGGPDLDYETLLRSESSSAPECAIEP